LLRVQCEKGERQGGYDWQYIWSDCLVLKGVNQHLIRGSEQDHNMMKGDEDFSL
jgi:hypothetical protein